MGSLFSKVLAAAAIVVLALQVFSWALPVGKVLADYQSGSINVRHSGSITCSGCD